MESQNRALTTLLVHQLQSTSQSDLSKPFPALESSLEVPNLKTSPSDSDNLSERLRSSGDEPNLTLTSSNLKKFNADQLSDTEKLISSEHNLENISERLKLSLEPASSTLNQGSLSITSPNLKHTNSFSSDIAISPSDRRKLSIEDKRRHQALCRLWAELRGSEATPQRLIEALQGVDSSLFVAPQRPVSLNLQLPVLQNLKCRRSRPILG